MNEHEGVILEIIRAGWKRIARVELADTTINVWCTCGEKDQVGDRVKLVGLAGTIVETLK